MKACARWSSKNPRRFELLEYKGGEQAWQHIDMGWDVAFDAITGGIFEFGFPDAIQQMWAAFLFELDEGKPKSRFAGCVTPDEVALTHRLGDWERRRSPVRIRVSPLRFSNSPF